MSCGRALEEMSAFLDGYPSEALEAHLAGCPACRGELEALRKADGALRHYSPLAWSPAMTAAVLARVTPRRRRPWLLPVAAALLAGIGALVAWPRGGVGPPIGPAPAPRDDEAALFARAERLLASGDEAGGVRAFNRLIEAQPTGLRANEACVALGRHYQARGDALAAAQAYSQITRPAVVSEEVAASIKKAGAEIGAVYMGGAPIQGLDAAAIRLRLENGEPFAIVRRNEILLLGNIDEERLRTVQRRNAAAIRESGPRRVVVNPQGLTEKDAADLHLPAELRRGQAK